MFSQNQLFLKLKKKKEKKWLLRAECVGEFFRWHVNGYM